MFWRKFIDYEKWALRFPEQACGSSDRRLAALVRTSVTSGIFQQQSCFVIE